MGARTIRFLTVAAVLSIGAALLPATGSAAPTASDPGRYSLCGRVFPDPQAYWPSPSQAPQQSPWAKGNGSCKAVDFLGWDETLAGLSFLASEEMFGDFVEVYDLSEEGGRFDAVLDLAAGEGKTAGLATENLGRESVPMYLVRVTDEEDTAIPIDEREHFAYALSIHGIERAGIEGGIRAIEDLATWGSCEKHGDEESPANCAQEAAGPEAPHPILETLPEESITAGEALKRSTTWFVLSNPDGWRRGDKQSGGFFFQRYNGNGVDMNRDWPTQGYTFRPYTPWSEPETRSVGKALQAIRPKWTGGIDLHGQLVDRAFSFTLIGGSERPFDKDRRVLQFTKGAWADAEQRLAWSSLIKPNDAPPQPDDPRVYGVQWGTVWDTINYTTTGSLGDWMDSPIGLDADAIDNEMSLSHLGNCGVGSCFIPEAEQLHVDGNKSLIYALLHYSLAPEDTAFDYKGRAAYLYNPHRVSDPGSSESTAPDVTNLPPQEPITTTINHGGGDSVFEFDVKGPDDQVYNGGIRAKVTFTNATGVSAGSVNEVAIDKRRSDEEDPPRGDDPGDEWQAQNTYFNQDEAYAQGGLQLDVNSPTPGRYRVRISGSGPVQAAVTIEFLQERAWPDPGQAPYDVSNMDFFPMLKRHVASPAKLTPVPVDQVLSGAFDLARFDTVVAADDAFLGGYREPQAGTPTQDAITGSVTALAPGAGQRNGATSAYFEFDITGVQESMTAAVTSATVVDPDLYVQRQLEDGSWSADVASGASGATQSETLTYGSPQPGHYRLEVHNWAGAPGPVDITLTFAGLEEVTNPTDYTAQDRDRMAAIAKAFVEQGGNLVLTDNSVQALGWMGLTPAGSVAKQSVYAGHVGFTADAGATDTYDDPLAANVNQPGAAEGDGHRHQIAEPVPTGFAIQNAAGGDFGTQPQWSVAREAFETAKGRVVGTLADDSVTLGEVPVGDGVVRLLGSLLPMPTEKYDHPYGLASYAITYSGYEVLRNLLDYENPNGALAAPTRAACDSQVPTGRFSDTSGNTHRANINCIAWYEITLGAGGRTYAPNRSTSRGQMASFIARLAQEGGLRLPSNPDDAFGDDDRNVHEASINALAEMGLVQGTGRRRFNPGADVTRAQMATFIANVHKAVVGELPTPAKDYFPDDDSSVHERNINALADMGVVQGREGRFHPDESVTRGQMASFIVHELGLEVAAGEAHFGGATITLSSTRAAPGGQVSGRVRTHKRIQTLLANGCGHDDDRVATRTDGSFTVGIGEGQSGECVLRLRVRTRRAGSGTPGQLVRHPFTITLTSG